MSENENIPGEKVKEYETKIQKLSEYSMILKNSLIKKTQEYETKVKEVDECKKEYTDIYALYQNFVK